MMQATGTDADLPISVTSAAEQFMRRMVRFSGLGANAGFRLVVKPGGCSGLSASFSVESAPAVGDQRVDVNGLALLLPLESSRLLAGVTIDFRDTPSESGLTFLDPKAEGCACKSVESVGVQLSTLR